MSETRPYPTEILQKWKSILSMTELKEEEINKLMEVVRYLQPPPSVNSLRKASHIYLIDHGFSELIDIIEKLSYSDLFEPPRDCSPP